MAGELGRPFEGLEEPQWLKQEVQWLNQAAQWLCEWASGGVRRRSG